MPVRILCVYAAAVSLLASVSGLQAAPTRATLPAGELAFIALANDSLVTVWADGSVAVYESSSGKNRCYFHLEPFRFRDTDFAVSGGSQPVLACLIATGADTECSFYDLQTGLCQGAARLEKSAPVDSAAFSATGRSLFCASGAQNAIFRVAVATRQVSRFGGERAKVFLPQYCADATAYVSFPADGSAIARTWKGQELWSLRGAYPLSWATLPPSPVLFVTDRAGRDVRAVRIADGKEVWRDGGMDGKHILACSPDGGRLALWDSNELQLVKLDGTRLKIAPAEKKTEVCFSPDSRRLLLLPSLEIAGEDHQRQPVLRRTNRLAQLVDCRTGQVIKRFALKLPQPASQTREPKTAVEEKTTLTPPSAPAAEPQTAKRKPQPQPSRPKPAPAAPASAAGPAFD